MGLGWAGLWGWVEEVGLGELRRWPSCLRMVRLTKMAAAVPHERAWRRATGKVLLRGKAAKEMLVTPTNTAIGAAAAAAWPGFGAL